MSEKLSVKHLVSVKDLTLDDISLILDTAKQFKEVINRPIKKVPSLRDFTIANVFFENSTRTKLSFELAQKRLSADIVNFSASGSSVQKGETLVDTVQNILAMKVDMVVMRHPSVGAASFLAQRIHAVVINAGDGTNEHPSQALLDVYSMLEKHPKIEGLKVLIVGDVLHSRVALSNIFLLQKLGAKVMVCGPATLIPKYISSLGVLVEYNIEKALQWCDVANILRIQKERQKEPNFPSDREYALYYGVNSALLQKVDHPVTIMHPGPINRGVEISSDVADSANSIILDQVENGVAVRMALVYLLSKR